MFEDFQPLNKPLLAGVRLPRISIEPRFYEQLEVSPDISNYEFLRRLCWKGVQEKGIDKSGNPQEYYDRIKSELGTLHDLGFDEYMLLNWEILNFCEENGIPTGDGRGCLNYEAPILTKNGYKPLGEIVSGEYVLNRFGKWAKVIQTHKYECSEKLLKFKIFANSNSDIRMTSDHKVLVVKNPFRYKGENRINPQDHVLIEEENAQWIRADEIQKGDYLIRAHVPTDAETQIIFDLAKYADSFDENWVYESHAGNTIEPLSKREISRKTGLSRNCLISILRTKQAKPKTFERLVEYLSSINKTLEDFYSYSSVKTYKLPRYVKLDENFAYVLGFFLGDGWWVERESRAIGFAFNQEVDGERQKIIEDYFTKFEISKYWNISKTKKLNQFTINSQILNKFFRELAPDKTNNKIIPWHILNQPDSILRSLLAGLIDSDGHVGLDGRISFDSTSKILAFQVRNLMERFGDVSSCHSRQQEKCAESFKIRGRRSKDAHYHSVNRNGFILNRVKEIREEEYPHGFVYDLSIEGDPSYHTDNFIVHNSAAGSMVANLLNVTKVDPLKHGLFFERFVSKSRARKIIDDDGTVFLDGSLVPDIDNDIDYSRRHEVIGFIENTHKGRTCKILTLNTLSGKLCIKEALKIVDAVNEDVANAVSNSIPKKFGKVLDFEDAIKESPAFAQYIKQYHRSYKVALKLEGLIKNTGVHPSGIAICHDNLDDTMPYGKTKDGDLISGFEMNDVASVAVKFDILGLRTLTVLDNVYKAVGINPEDIDLNDQEVFNFLQNLVAPQGLFQIETETGFRVCQKVKPKNIYDLSAVLAIARPGALAFADQYAKFSNTGEYQSIHPYFDDVLKFTGGIPLYQEELISCARKIGFTADEGEQLRRSSAKKKPEEIAKWKDRIIEKVKENNLDPKIGDVLWKLAEDSAGYSFNYSHSLAYATCSFRTIYCKVHHTKEFFLALLKMAQNEPDPLTEIFKISQELALFNIKLLPPDLSKSKEEFSIEGKDLRYGLNSIRGISEKSIQNLLTFRGHEFKNKYEVFQTAKDCGLNIGVLCTLIQAGCLDSFGENRCKMVLEAQMFNKLTENEKFAVLELGEHHNYDIFAALKDGAEGKIINAKNKSAFTEKRIQKLRDEHGKYKTIYDQNIRHQKFCNWYFEREMLGYSYSYTLREVFEESKHTFTPILEFNSLDDNETVRIVGVVTEVKKTTSKKGNKYMMLSISDESGKLSGMFGDNAKDNKWSRHLEEKLPVPEEDSVVTVVGKKFGDLLMIDKFSIVEETIYTRLSQVK